MILIKMKKLLKKKDIFLLTLAGIEDVIEEIRDPLNIVSDAYKNMYGFVPKPYRRNNFSSLVSRSLKTGYIDKFVKDGKSYLRLTFSGKNYLKREFPIAELTKQWNKKWIMVIFDIEEKSRRQRNRLRDILKNIGFGMLQQSVWITSLSIGQDMKEFISNQNFSENAFVLEVSHMLLGDPKELARKVWDLDRFEEKYLELKEEKERLNESVKNSDGRQQKRHIEIEEKLRENKKKTLEFLIFLPALPKELLPETLGKLVVT